MPDSPSADALFVRLLTANHDQLRRYIFTLLPHEQDAQDVMQETCLALAGKFADYDQSRPFLPWACGFAYLKVLQHRDRHPQRAVLLPADVLELVASARREEEPLLAARLAVLDRCLEKLAPDDRDLIRARYVDRVAPDEIAARLNISRRSTFRHLERVRRLLHACIDRGVAGWAAS
jgi:RNA polymerase sigma-70 factor (ECF subfamily)